MFRRLFRPKVKKPKCPECGNRKFNREVRRGVWVCGSCHRKWAIEPVKKGEPKQIGKDVEDDEFEDLY